MERDYRNTPYCEVLVDVRLKKSKLSNDILLESPRTKIMHNRVKENRSSYKTKFMEIYNFKCSYCGNSIDNLSLYLFEIDHYIYESSFESKEEAGRMINLVLACYDCNRSKNSFLIKEDYLKILNPDLDDIKNVFVRDTLFYIQISEEYKEDEYIKDFYNKLKLGYQSRRLDYLLLNLNALCKSLDEIPQMSKLNIILRELRMKRNLMSFKIAEPSDDDRFEVAVTTTDL